MGKKIGGIILIVCALFTAFLGIKAAGNASGNQEIIKDAVYVADGKVLPENEDKVVIVNGTLDAPLPFVDDETGIELDSIVAYRRVEKARVVLGSDGKKDTWSWDSTISENDLGGSVHARKVQINTFVRTKFRCGEALFVGAGPPPVVTAAVLTVQGVPGVGQVQSRLGAVVVPEDPALVDVEAFAHIFLLSFRGTRRLRGESPLFETVSPSVRVFLQNGC